MHITELDSLSIQTQSYSKERLSRPSPLCRLGPQDKPAQMGFFLVHRSLKYYFTKAERRVRNSDAWICCWLLVGEIFLAPWTLRGLSKIPSRPHQIKITIKNAQTVDFITTPKENLSYTGLTRVWSLLLKLEPKFYIIMLNNRQNLQLTTASMWGVYSSASTAGRARTSRL